MTTPSPDTLRLLAGRRSAPAKLMEGPGPTAAQTDEILELAARVPDHRMVEPFRFIVLDGEGKAAFAERLKAFADRSDKAPTVAAMIARVPVVIAVIATPDRDHKTPVYEQQLTVGAACQNLLVAATAQGWDAQWLTGWAAEADEVAELLRLDTGERVAGFFYIGTSPVRPDERKRPDLSAKAQRWTAPA